MDDSGSAGHAGAAAWAWPKPVALTPLLTALHARRQDEAMALLSPLDPGLDLGAPDDGGMTALGIAAGAGFAAVVRRPLDLGAVTTRRPGLLTTTPLMAAAGGGHADVVGALLRCGRDVGPELRSTTGASALHLAVAGGSAAVVRAPPDRGASGCCPLFLSGRQPFDVAARAGRADLVEALVESGRCGPLRLLRGGGPGALASATGRGDAPMVRYLLGKGAASSGGDGDGPRGFASALVQGAASGCSETPGLILAAGRRGRARTSWRRICAASRRCTTGLRRAGRRRWDGCLRQGRIPGRPTLAATRR